MRWAPVPFGGNRYEVSDTGLVRNRATQKLIAQNPCGPRRSYPGVSLWNGEMSRTFAVHRLVAPAFVPKPQNATENLQINHINGDRRDSRASNLEWVTLLVNIRHSSRTGLNKRVFSFEIATEIREIVARGSLSQKEIAQSFGVSCAAVSAIVRGKVYRPEVYRPQPGSALATPTHP